MKTAKELREELSAVFNGLRDGTIDAKTASELANISGKMINSARAQLEYYSLRGEVPIIEFLSCDDEATSE